DLDRGRGRRADPADCPDRHGLAQRPDDRYQELKHRSPAAPRIASRENFALSSTYRVAGPTEKIADCGNSAESRNSKTFPLAVGPAHHAKCIGSPIRCLRFANSGYAFAALTPFGAGAYAPAHGAGFPGSDKGREAQDASLAGGDRQTGRHEEITVGSDRTG